MMMTPLNGAPLNGDGSGVWASAADEAVGVSSVAQSRVLRRVRAPVMQGTAAVNVVAYPLPPVGEGSGELNSTSLNGAALNGSSNAGGVVEYAYGEATGVAAATRIRVMSAVTAAAESTSTSTLQRSRLAFAESTALADETATNRNTTTMASVSIESVAGEAVVGVRTAYFDDAAFAEATTNGWYRALTDNTGLMFGVATGEAVLKKYTWAPSGSGTALAEATGTFLRITEPAFGGGEATASSTSDNQRQRIVSLDPTTSVAEASGAAIRSPIATAAGTAVAETTGTSFMKAGGRAIGTAEASVTLAPTVLATTPVLVSVTAAAAATATGEDTRLAKPVLRKMRTASQTYLAESLVRVLRVRQIPQTAAGVARSKTRALPNTKILLGTLVLVAKTVNTAGSLRVYHDMTGTSVGEVLGQTVPGRITIISGNPTATATANLAPSITRAGVKYSYFSAVSVAESTQYTNGLKITEPPGPLELTAYSEIEASPFLTQDMTGEGSASSEALGSKRVNNWKRGRAVTQARAEIKDKAYVRADARVVPGRSAESLALGTAVRQPQMTGAGTGQASETNTVIRLVKMVSQYEGLANTESAARINTWRPFTGAGAAQSSTWADGLRITRMEHLSFTAEAARIPHTFKINAGAPAPDSRTIEVAATERVIEVPATEREYLVA